MKKIYLLLQLLIFSTSIFSNNSSDFKIQNLLVEYTKQPLGMDVHNPGFSWQMYSESIGESQKAYNIVVEDENGQTVWNTGKIKSDRSLNISYSGVKLKPVTRYNWTVTVWNKKGKKSSASSWFETGLMDSGWNDGKWLGGKDEYLPFFPHYLPVFKLFSTLQISVNSKTKSSGFVYGANDERLKSKKDSSYIRIELEVKQLPAKLNIYRVGYTKDDKKDKPLLTFNINLNLINENNLHDNHQIIIHSNLGITQIYIDGEKKENLVADVVLNPYGRGGDYFAFPVIGDISCNTKIQIRNFRNPSNIIYSNESSSDNQSIINPGRNSMPMLRTLFKAGNNKIKSARLYITAKGIYDFYINGKRINDDYFNPGLSQYNKTHFYQTYDVTRFINGGKNAMGAILGEGWWSGASTYTGENWNFFGDRQSLLAKLLIKYEDGSHDIIVTDPNTWKYYNNGPLVYSSFFQGEVYDATKEVYTKNWSSPDYNDSNWSDAVEIKDEKNTYPFDFSKTEIICQIGNTINVVKKLTAISVEEVRKGVFVYDMGQNMAGVPEITFSDMKPGDKITMRFAEVRYPDLPEYKENTGMIMLENIRAAMAQDIYICKGGNEVFSPRFTYHGYRYVEITGIEKAISTENVKGIVISSIDSLSSHYETSNKKVNRLWENIVWSTYANFMSVPTDCPQRNERLGWSGDISVFSRTACYLSAVPQFFRRHLLAMRNTQSEDGRFPDVAPLDFGFGGLLWGSAGITVAWETYQQYGDVSLLIEHYDAMKNYIQFVLKNYIDPETNVIVQRRAGLDLGDWLSLEDNKNDRSLLWESYFLFDLEIMGKIAKALNKTHDAEEFYALYQKRKNFFNNTYINAKTARTISSGYHTTRVRVPEKGKEVDTQTSYALPLAFNIVKDSLKNQFVQNFKQSIVRENKTDNNTKCPPYSLMTGFIGTAWINKALSDNDMNEEAYKLLQQTSYPSWLYPVEQGATTIWERLNSYTHLNGFGGNNRMNSFNHYSFGAVGAWMYEYSIGIKRDENYPGFKHFILAPQADPTGEMKYAKGYFDSMYGRIESSWEIKDGITAFKFTIPANTTATLYLPKKVVGNKRYKGVKVLGTENGLVKMLVNPGKYAF